jgi:two-component system phosphate regulon response regulator OmpR
MNLGKRVFLSPVTSFHQRNSRDAEMFCYLGLHRLESCKSLLLLPAYARKRCYIFLMNMHNTPQPVSRKILIVDDDRRLRDLLRRYLTQQGFIALSAQDGRDMNKIMQREHFDLLVLDLMLPGEDGLSICRRLRSIHDTTPIIMLTAKTEEIDRIIGLEMGADDYLSKPFNPRELAARIKAILRRRSIEEHPGAPSHENESINFGPFILNLATRTLERNDQPITITTGEFSVLKAFGRHPKVPLSRDKLMELARGREYEAYDRSLDVQISRLRKLIETNPSKPKYIQTVWGMGYVFVPDGGR